MWSPVARGLCWTCRGIYCTITTAHTVRGTGDRLTPETQPEYEPEGQEYRSVKISLKVSLKISLKITVGVPAGHVALSQVCLIWLVGEEWVPGVHTGRWRGSFCRAPPAEYIHSTLAPNFSAYE